MRFLRLCLRYVFAFNITKSLFNRLLPAQVKRKISSALNLDSSPENRALEHVERIKTKQLCDELNIPDTIELLEKADIGILAKAALKEAHYFYPVPKYMDQQQCSLILTRLLP